MSDNYIEKMQQLNEKLQSLEKSYEELQIRREHLKMVIYYSKNRKQIQHSKLLLKSVEKDQIAILNTINVCKSKMFA